MLGIREKTKDKRTNDRNNTSWGGSSGFASRWEKPEDKKTNLQNRKSCERCLDERGANVNECFLGNADIPTIEERLTSLVYRRGPP